MSEKTNVNEGEILNTLLGIAVIAAAIILYFKTSDVFSYFAPKNLSDYFNTDTNTVALFYGNITAILVEGVAVILHFHGSARRSQKAQVVKWLLLGLSGLCQVYDGFITQDRVEDMSEAMKFILTYGVPLIPLLILVLLFWMGKFGTAEGGGGSFMGIIPWFKHLFGGSDRKASTPQPQSPGTSYTLSEFLTQIGLSADEAKKLVKGCKNDDEAFKILVLDRGKGEATDIARKNFRKLYYTELNPQEGQQDKKKKS